MVWVIAATTATVMVILVYVVDAILQRMRK